MMEETDQALTASNRQVPTTNTTPGHEEVVEFDCPDTRRELLKRLYQSQVNESIVQSYLYSSGLGLEWRGGNSIPTL